jgi:hypothetical protein
MSRTRRMPMKIVIAALGATVALAPSASARVLDPVPLTASPDVQSSQDLRSPDTRDVAAAQSSRWQAYDEAVRHLTPAQQAAAFVPPKAAAPASAPSSEDRVDPRIAVGGVLAALLLGLRGLVLVARRRNASAPAVSS